MGNNKVSIGNKIAIPCSLKCILKLSKEFGNFFCSWNLVCRAVHFLVLSFVFTYFISQITVHFLENVGPPEWTNSCADHGGQGWWFPCLSHHVFQATVKFRVRENDSSLGYKTTVYICSAKHIAYVAQQSGSGWLRGLRHTSLWGERRGQITRKMGPQWLD